MDFAGIERARALLRDSIPVTRLVPADSLAQASAAHVYLKLENEAPTSSFKCRGALHTLCQQVQRGPVAGVVTSSTGNHGAAIAWAARRMGVPALIFLPEHPNPVKRARIAQQGARIVEAGRDVEESREHAARYAAEHDWFLVVDGQDEDLTSGAATVGCEIVEQLPSTDVIYVPVGDSSLIRGWNGTSFQLLVHPVVGRRGRLILAIAHVDFKLAAHAAPLPIREAVAHAIEERPAA